MTKTAFLYLTLASSGGEVLRDRQHDSFRYGISVREMERMYMNKWEHLARVIPTVFDDALGANIPESAVMPVRLT